MLPTLARVLELDAVRRGDPQVLAGADRLDTRVRWVHVAEVAEIAHLLRGGELVLTTGIALPDDPARLRAYVADLAEVGVSGLMVELGRRHAGGLPAALLAAGEEHGVPVITLARETAFIDITESVHAHILESQLEELRAAERLHETFTRLSVEGASPDEVVHQTATIAGRPVVLENLAHQVLAADTAGRDASELLSAWEARSRAVRPDERTAFDESSRWLVTLVGARGEDWGRLIMPYDVEPGARDIVLIERAATTLALGRLLDRHAESVERQAHGTVIAGILAHAFADPREVAVRARALGVPLSGRRLIGVVVRHRPAPASAAPAAPPRPPGPVPERGGAVHRGAASARGAGAATPRGTGAPARKGTGVSAGTGTGMGMGPGMSTGTFTGANSGPAGNPGPGGRPGRDARRGAAAGRGAAPRPSAAPAGGPVPIGGPVPARGAGALRGGAAGAQEVPERLTELAEATAASCREAGLAALVGVLDEGTAQARVGVLASLPARADGEAAPARAAERLRARCGTGIIVAAGSVVETVHDARRSLLEAEQVAAAASHGSDDRLVYRLPDLRLRGLLYLLRDDARLRTFVERELGPLLEYDAEYGTDLVGVLGCYLQAGQNKVLAAKLAHLSRPSFYERLRHIGRILDADLGDAESCLSLHVALLGLQSLRSGPP